MKADLKTLYGQVKKLPAREQEVIRLRYADGLNYKDLAAASNSSVEEVVGLLVAGLNSLRGHKGKGDKSRYLAFVHGELNEADTETMAELVEADPGARAEFESILAISDALTDLYDALAEQKDKKKNAKTGGTLEQIRAVAMALKSGKGLGTGGRPKRFIAGAFFAVAAAIVIYIFIDMKSTSEPEMNDDAAIAAAIAADTANTPPVEAESQPQDAVPPSEALPEPEAAAPTPMPLPSPPPPMPAPVAAPKPTNANRTMMVDTAKTVIPKNINKKTALSFFGKKFNKAPSCIPAKDKKSKLIKAVIGVTKNGTYTQVIVQTPIANKGVIAKCLKGRLGETAKSLRTNNKSGTKITLVLKVI